MTGQRPSYPLIELEALDALEWGTIDRFLAGQATPADEQIIQAWRDGHPRGFENFLSLRKALRSGEDTPLIDLDIKQRAVVAREVMKVDYHRKRPREDRGLAGSQLRRWMVYVAAVAVVLGVGQIAFFKRAPDSIPQRRTYTTANGQRASIVLSDGTKVMLNVASRLSVPLDFGKTSRSLYLEGEARFDVMHDNAKPFVVYAGGAVVRDLATVFGVRAYPGAPSTQVVVASGKVAIKSDAAPQPNGATLLAGQAANITVTGETTVSKNVPVDDLLGWTTGRLVIDNIPMRDALTLLSRWYDVQFEVRDSSQLAGTLTATVQARPLTEKDLADLAYILGARVTMHGRLVTISSATGR